ncbi:MAG: hypothetical protein JJU29_23775 [Verrucomicrobia bacterium]|nr:hypothetical protein [Verrucomicrobiota bacterium]
MENFTQDDLADLLNDLVVYCGWHVSVSDIHGPFEHDNHAIGKLHTSMDDFNFTVLPEFCSQEKWTIQLSSPSQSIIRGHRSFEFFSFPKIHTDACLVNKYAVANKIFDTYNSYSNLTEKDRLKELEAQLGYENLLTMQNVIDAIISDFRSYQEKLEKEKENKIQRN